MEKPKRKPRQKPSRLRQLTPELLIAARQKLSAWTPSDNSQIGLLRQLATEIDHMMSRGGRHNDVRDALGELGLEIGQAALRDFLRERKKQGAV